MIYPKDFVDRVLKAHPNSPEIKKFLEIKSKENFVNLCHFLRENSSNNMPIDIILKAKSLQEIQEKALLEKEKYLLYLESLELIYEIFPPQNFSKKG